ASSISSSSSSTSTPSSSSSSNSALSTVVAATKPSSSSRAALTAASGSAADNGSECSSSEEVTCSFTHAADSEGDSASAVEDVVPVENSVSETSVTGCSVASAMSSILSRAPCNVADSSLAEACAFSAVSPSNAELEVNSSPSLSSLSCTSDSP